MKHMYMLGRSFGHVPNELDMTGFLSRGSAISVYPVGCMLKLFLVCGQALAIYPEALNLTKRRQLFQSGQENRNLEVKDLRTTNQGYTYWAIPLQFDNSRLE